MDDVLTIFGRAVRDIRRDKGLSQEELAERCGLHRTYVGGIERGKRNVALRNILAIAHALDVPPEVLFQGYDEATMLELVRSTYD